MEKIDIKKDIGFLVNLAYIWLKAEKAANETELDSEKIANAKKLTEFLYIDNEEKIKVKKMVTSILHVQHFIKNNGAKTYLEILGKRKEPLATIENRFRWFLSSGGNKMHARVVHKEEKLMLEIIDHPDEEKRNKEELN